jgi:hypothetical protein
MARLPSGPYWPPVDQIREWYRPQARIAGRLTSSRLISSARTAAFCQLDAHCPAVWPVCYIPLGKLPVRFDDLKMHSNA